MLEPYRDLESDIKKFSETNWSAARVSIGPLLESVMAKQENVSRLPYLAKSWNVFKRYNSLLSSYVARLTIVEALAKADLKDRHWDKLRGMLKCQELNAIQDFETLFLWNAALLENRCDDCGICTIFQIILII